MGLNNLQYFAKGGGCFLEDTPITTPDGSKFVQDFVPGDEVISYDEKTGEQVTSTVERLDILATREFYYLNYDLKVTGEHPFYTVEYEKTNKPAPDDYVEKLVVKKVSELKVGDVLKTLTGYEEIRSKQLYVEDKVIYNLINVTPNNNYYAAGYLVHNKGGGCFLAGTKIVMREGPRNIEDVKAGDRIWTLNEKTRMTEIATVGEVQVLESDGYYVINNEVKATGSHPFYVDEDGKTTIKNVEDLKIGDFLIKNYDNFVKVQTLEYVEEKVTVYNLVNVDPNHNYLANGYLVHNKGGGGGHASSSGAKSSGSSSKSSSSTSSKPAAPKPGVSKAKPGSTVKTADGKTVTSRTKAPTQKGYSTSKGVVGDNGYSPRFTNGYSAPPGSVVYYRDTSFVDYLPWIYLFGHSNAAPANQTATVVQPDGKEVVAKPQPGGTDGLAILNWVLLILIVAGIIGGIVWGVNKYASRNDPPKKKTSFGGYY